jgi:hypothetical protein
MVPLLVALIVAMSVTLSSSETAQARRLAVVGGYGVILHDATTYSYNSTSNFEGVAYQGEIVYIKGWQTGGYYINERSWVAETALEPIINARGQPIVDYVRRQGNTYYMNDQPISLPPIPLSHADQFLANPTVSAPIIYQGSSVPSDRLTELVDTSAVWFSPRYPVVATMRVTDAYDLLYLYTGPDPNAPKANSFAYKNDVLTVYEVQGDWYRINGNLWVPSQWGDEVYLVPENMSNYAPSEYYNGGKWISIDLAHQQMTAWEGNDVILNGPVKTGSYNWYTPAGVYKIFEKVPNERMSGPGYDLIDVAWAQYFTYSRIAIHAAYWRYQYDGNPNTYGCVNTPEDIAKRLFMWSPVGTTVVTHNPYIFSEQDIANPNGWNE